ncbi:hypothetical protein EAF04_005513 [Stromatinia cepivora]|nr:hypothetical protein EAF04_005513 [Stromatinia cepivora]
MSQETKTKTTPAQAEINLTFGLEFVLATGYPGKPDPHPNDPREIDGNKLSDVNFINYDIQKKLTAVGIPSIVDEWDDTRPDSVVTHSEEEYETCWVLKADKSVGDGDGGQKWNKLYRKNGMEMSSPPYYYTESARNAIRTVLGTLKNSYRVRVDNTAGLHFHVGNSYNGLQFPILQKLLAIAHTYEPQLLLIVSEDPEFLEKILGYTDNSSLLEDLGGAPGMGRLAFNIEGLKTPYANGRRTIEFRHHHGSLDSGAIFNWIHVCVKFVEKAFFAKVDELFMRLRQNVSKPVGLGEGELSTIDFLMWLGCPAQAYYYGINMVMDKAALEDGIKNDVIRHQRHLEWARERRLWIEETEDEDEDSKLTRMKTTRRANRRATAPDDCTKFPPT